jgi:hypothetical protein
MAEGKRCEWCGATGDLILGMTGDPLQEIWICANQLACRDRWPKKWSPGTVAVPASRIEETS